MFVSISDKLSEFPFIWALTIVIYYRIIHTIYILHNANILPTTINHSFRFSLSLYLWNNKRKKKKQNKSNVLHFRPTYTYTKRKQSVLLKEEPKTNIDHNFKQIFEANNGHMHRFTLNQQTSHVKILKLHYQTN